MGVLQVRRARSPRALDAWAGRGTGFGHRMVDRAAAARPSTELLRAAFERALDAIAVVDGERRFVSVNPAACDLLGAEAEEICGRRVDDFTADDLLPDLDRRWHAYRGAGELSGELRIRRPDAEERVVEFRTSAGVLPGLHVAFVRDLTAARRTESMLVEAVERFERAFEDAPIAMAIVSLDPATAGCVRAANRRLAEHLGYDEHEVAGLDLGALARPDDTGAGIEEIGRLLSGELGSGSVETRFARRGGAVFRARIRLSEVRGASQGAYAIVHLEDLSDAGAATESLKRGDTRFRRLADNAEDIVFVYRLLPERGFEYINEAAARLTGYSTDELRSDPRLALALVHPDDRGLLQSDAFFDRPLTLRWVTRSGRTVWTEQHAVPVRDEEGRLVAVQGIARDITARRRAEQEFERLALVVETSEDAILSTDAHGRVTSWNPGAERLYGYSAQEMIGRPLDTLHPAGLDDPPHRLWRRAQSGETVSGFETRRVTKDGDTVDVAITASPVRDSEGELVGISQIVRDMTERRRMEQTLLRYADEDGLTGLFNRRRFEEEVARQLDATERDGQAGALVTLDVDHFKVVNDSLGHGAGDRVLGSVAQALRDR